MQVKKPQLKLNMEQWADSKMGREYGKAVYCHPCYLTSIQSTSCKMPGWMKHKLESRLPREMSITLDMQMTLPYGRKWRGTKESLDEGEREEWKIWLKTQYSKNKIMAFSAIISWKIDQETMETVTDFIFLGSKINADSDCSYEINNLDIILKGKASLCWQRSV